MIKERASLTSVLPPIVITTDEARRLYALANSNMALFPVRGFFLAREMNRANVVPDNAADLRGVVHMGSQVRYCDHKTGDVRDVVLVYPHEAQIALQAPLGSYAGRGGTDRPIGRANHRIPNAGPSNAVVDCSRYIKLKGG